MPEPSAERLVVTRSDTDSRTIYNKASEKPKQVRSASANYMATLSAPYIRAIFPNGIIVGNCTINSCGDRANFVWDKRKHIDEDVIILAKYNCEETIAHLDDVITFEGWGEVWSDTLRELIVKELNL